MEDKEFKVYAVQLVEEAQRQGALLRLLGAVAPYCCMPGSVKPGAKCLWVIGSRVGRGKVPPTLHRGDRRALKPHPQLLRAGRRHPILQGRQPCAGLRARHRQEGASPPTTRQVH